LAHSVGYEQYDLICGYRADEWFPKKESRDQQARKNYFANRRSARHKGEIYVMQLLDEEMKPDDARLR
jgi:hypothetical protein